jgi:integrase
LDFETAAIEASEGRFMESRARKVISDIFHLGHDQAMNSSTVADFLDSWLVAKELEAGEATYERYATVVDQFRKFLGSKVKRDLCTITSTDITKFRDTLAKRVAPGTVNISLKILRSAFSKARREGLIDVNEVSRVEPIKRHDRFSRRAFTIEELKDILKAANDEWKGIVLFALYTGARLGDIASLTWQNILLDKAELQFETAKTGRASNIPLAAPLLRYVESLPAGDDPSQPLFPKAHATVQRQGRTGNLSNEFYAILVASGLAKPRTHKSTGKGRSVKRDQSDVSFHSLRHTATSLLKNAGVSNAVAQEFIGHESDAISRVYTHIDSDALRAAAAKLPDITK